MTDEGYMNNVLESVTDKSSTKSGEGSAKDSGSGYGDVSTDGETGRGPIPMVQGPGKESQVKQTTPVNQNAGLLRTYRQRIGHRLTKVRQRRTRQAAPCQEVDHKGDVDTTDDGEDIRGAAIASQTSEETEESGGSKCDDESLGIRTILKAPQDPSTGLPRRRKRRVSWLEQGGEVVAEYLEGPDVLMNDIRDPDDRKVSNTDGRTHTGNKADPISDADIHQACAWRKAVRHAESLGIPKTESEFRPCLIVLWRSNSALVFCWKSRDRHRLQDSSFVKDYVMWERREFIRRSPPFTWEDMGHMGCKPSDREI